jgi:hypothetical protein
MVTFSN